jgi:hypothetical protein
MRFDVWMLTVLCVSSPAGLPALAFETTAGATLLNLNNLQVWHLMFCSA